ncbi:two-component system, chemotaxis family, sensor kinase CheA [Roseateles sp. YR242]|uniref:hybrid sensor histidine kinase/response regulator n=1 Tax=Roseateles sp. YR242 TaxID=1855305 RepID=UPI0008C9572B|nr:hybrid sensor histidine kinase/response regulator [Roseateles sp. YR242]SEK94433.1 two-component system, chemotaxis family, sensor kinase CheA [Roseateles sp. YR242]
MAKDPYRYFRVEARDLLTQMSETVLAAEQAEPAQALEVPAKMLRLAHTLKGAASVVRLPTIAGLAHAIEDLLTPLRDSARPPSRDDLDAVLAVIDEASQAVAALSGNATPLTAPGYGAAQSSTASASPAASPAASLTGSPVAPDQGTAINAGPSAPVGSPPPPLEGTASATAADVDVDALPLPIMEIPQIVSKELDTLSDSVGESLAHVSTLKRLGAQIADLRKTLPMAPEDLATRLLRLEEQLERGGRQLERELLQTRDYAEQLRLVPASLLFGPLQRAARDAARSLGKQVMFQARGEAKLEGGVLNALLGALVQMIRNAVAHGIEAPEARLAAGKAAQGRIELLVSREGRQVRLRCIDDGAGIDMAALRRTAVAKGVPNAAHMDEPALIERLLRGGLSTARQVDALAGRGVGMDLVRDTVARLGGQLTLQSQHGQGTTLEMRVPLQLGAVRALNVFADGLASWVPLDAVVQVVQRPVINGRQMALGQELVPHVALAELLNPGRQRTQQAPGAALILRSGAQQAAIGVDGVDGVATVVWRPPPALLPPSKMVIGLALDAEQQPLAVLNPEGLIEAARRARPQAAPPARRAATILVIDDSLTTRMLEQSILEAAGYRVHMASSAEDGLEAARRERYALILVDVEMPPGMDGFSFVEKLRADEDLRSIPAVLVSSRNAPEDLARGAAAGADGYIIKGEFSQNAFLDKVAELVARSQLAGLTNRTEGASA